MPPLVKFLRIKRKNLEDWMAILGRNAQYAIQRCFSNPTPDNFKSVLQDWRDWAFTLYYLHVWAGDSKTEAILRGYLERFYLLIHGLEQVAYQMTIVHDPTKTIDTSQRFFSLLVGRQ